MFLNKYIEFIKECWKKKFQKNMIKNKRWIKNCRKIFLKNHNNIMNNKRIFNCIIFMYYVDCWLLIQENYLKENGKKYPKELRRFFD